MKHWKEAFKDTDWSGVLLFLIAMAMTVLCTVLTVFLVYKWFIS
jgi:hypothetical protein